MSLFGGVLPFHWKAIGFALKSHRLCTGKPVALHWKAEEV